MKAAGEASRSVPTLRRATLRDLDTLVDHRRAMWRAMGGFTASDLDAADRVYRRWVRPRLASGGFVAWIAESRGKALASGGLWLTRIHPRPRAPGGRVAYLMSVYTAPEARRKGLATRITKAAIAEARARDVEAVTLHASRQGRSVYARLGFDRTWEMRKTLER